MKRLVLVGLLAGCSQESPPAAPPPAVSSSPVAWVAAKAPGTSMLLEAPAYVVQPPGGRAAVSAPMRARVEAVLVQPGATVEAKTPLVEVAMPEIAAAAATYLAAVEELSAHEKRAAELTALRAEGLVRRTEVSALELEVARLRGERDVAAATLRSAGLGTGDARSLAASGGRTTLRSPSPGVVVSVNAIVGASHAPEDLLVELSARAGHRVEAQLPRPLPAGERVEFVAHGEAPVVATLVTTAGMRETDGTMRAWFDLERAVPAGTTGRVRVAGGVAGAAVPATAVEHGPQGDIVWRNDHGTARAVPVRVIASSGGDMIVEGVEPGTDVASVAADVPRGQP